MTPAPISARLDEMDSALYSHMAQRRLDNSAENARWSSGPGKKNGR